MQTKCVQRIKVEFIKSSELHYSYIFLTLFYSTTLIISPTFVGREVPWWFVGVAEDLWIVNAIVVLFHKKESNKVISTNGGLFHSIFSIHLPDQQKLHQEDVEQKHFAGSGRGKSKFVGVLWVGHNKDKIGCNQKEGAICIVLSDNAFILETYSLCWFFSFSLLFFFTLGTYFTRNSYRNEVP